jgi:hypothetical protein
LATQHCSGGPLFGRVSAVKGVQNDVCIREGSQRPALPVR